ncbi:MAG: Amuc_1101 family PilM-like pilus complex protein [Chthoniobacteraceae bacterium]
MAVSNRILALDLGTQTVALAEFQAEKGGGLVLTNYKTGELLGDPAVDATRMAQTKMTAGELVAGLGFKGAKVNYAVSAQSVFTRFVKLPSVGEEQVDQIVGFEAQQNVPFPIDEVVWDYQLVDQGNASEVEVVLVAIKSDLLDEINDAVEGGGLKTEVVDVSPMALYNAFRYNYSELDGCSLIVDIGARTTNLIFVEPRKVFSRSIPIGGSKITEAIAKDFNESFAEAEERKRSGAFVSLGGTYEDPDDPDLARVSKIIRNTMTRLHAEISRSISFYRAQQKGAAPLRVFLCGGTVTLPYMREFFHEKLQLPVEFFNPLRNVAVGPNLNPEEIGHRAHTLGEMVGLALRGAMDCPMALNLRPASVVRRQRAVAQVPYFALAGLCLWLIIAGFWLYYEKAADATAKVVAENVEPRVGSLQSAQRKIKDVEAAIKNQERMAEPYLLAVQDRELWVKLVDDIHSRLPNEFVWITTYERQKETAPGRGAATPPPKGPAAAGTPPPNRPSFLVRGLYLENPIGPGVVDQFVDKLNESTLYSVDKEKMTRVTPTDTEWAYEFSFPLVLKGPAQPEPEPGKPGRKPTAGTP